eukprot:TRINITY_DN11542_c0_g1_i1.p1 TRINITY_DN11542_c0_g1~~TRINITY_DN11542_c0_g1_i1.p1  ORF type:complete len:124 (-),score=30.47 TRINITY_DN11542_c0_g1_i1:55-426(-)
MDKQLIDLQSKLSESSYALSHCLNLITLNQREKQRGIASIQELEEMSEKTPSYKSVGRMFIKEDLPELKNQLKQMLTDVDEQIKTLDSRKEYIKKQVKQDEDNLNEVVSQINKQRMLKEQDKS